MLILKLMIGIDLVDVSSLHLSFGPTLVLWSNLFLVHQNSVRYHIMVGIEISTFVLTEMYLLDQGH